MPHHDLPAHRPPSSTSTQSLGESLGPALQKHCDGRLGPIEWFRVSWQHGGAATGFSTWRTDCGKSIGVLLKLPVGPSELRWTAALGAVDQDFLAHPERCDHATPRVLASGECLGGYDIAWVVTERLAPTTLAHALTEQSVTEMLLSLDRFHQAALTVRPVEGSPTTENWELLIERSRQAARAGGISDSQRWNEAVKRVQKVLPWLIARWNSRPLNAWCHGDFHANNALRRVGQERGCVLIDLAMVHPGHWLEDALYLERQFWARPELLFGIKPVSFLAKLHRERGMVDPGYAELANVRRALMAASALAFVSAEGHPKYLHACLEMLERTLPQLPH